MKLIIYISFFLFAACTFGQSNSSPFTPEVHYELKRKIIKLHFAHSIYDFMQYSHDSLGSFIGNKKILSKGSQNYKYSEIRRTWPGFGYGYNDNLWTTITPVNFNYPDTSWQLYNLEFKIDKKFQYITSFFKNIRNLIGHQRWYYTIAVNEEGKVRYLTDEVERQKKITDFLPQLNPHEPSSYHSLISFCLHVKERYPEIEKINYIKKIGDSLLYNLILPDSFEVASATCKIPVTAPQNIHFDFKMTEKYKKPEWTSYKMNDGIKQNIIKDNVMKGIYGYQLSQAMTPSLLKKEIDAYFLSEGSILDSLIPDFDETFFYDIYIRRALIGTNDGEYFDVFVPSCKVLKKPDDDFYRRRYKLEEYDYRLDFEGCVDWDEKGFLGEVRRAKDKRKKEFEASQETYDATIKKLQTEYEEKLKNWSEGKPEPSPPPPPPPRVPIRTELDPNRYIYSADTKEEYYSDKNRYLVNFGSGLRFFSGESVFLDPCLYKSMHTGKKQEISKLIEVNKELATMNWKRYAAIRLQTYSAPISSVKGYLDYYDVIELTNDKVVIETYGVKKDLPWLGTPMLPEFTPNELIMKGFGISYGSYDFSRYAHKDRVKLRMTINFEEDFEWFTVEKID